MLMLVLVQYISLGYRLYSKLLKGLDLSNIQVTMVALGYMIMFTSVFFCDQSGRMAVLDVYHINHSNFVLSIKQYNGGLQNMYFCK